MISPVPFARDLGVYTDERLSYYTHITKIVSSCFNQLDRQTLILLIKRFVFSKLLLLLDFVVKHF